MDIDIRYEKATALIIYRLAAFCQTFTKRMTWPYRIAMQSALHWPRCFADRIPPAVPLNADQRIASRMARLIRSRLRSSHSSPRG